MKGSLVEFFDRRPSTIIPGTYLDNPILATGTGREAEMRARVGDLHRRGKKQSNLVGASEKKKKSRMSPKSGGS